MKASPKKTRKRNLRTVADLVEEKKQPQVKWSPKFILKGFFIFLGSILRWLNQSVSVHHEDSGSDGSLAQSLTKHRSIAPKYVRQSFAEVKLVTWPGFLVAMRLTTAVFLFAAFLLFWFPA